MRLYIASRTNGPRCPLYKFAQRIESALFWQEMEKEWVGRCCKAFSEEEITINPPAGDGMTPCTDFRIEHRLNGSLVISCEAPTSGG